MSCNQRETGTFKFKKAGYNEVMRKTREMLQVFTDYQFSISELIYAYLKENKVKKNKTSAINTLTVDHGQYHSFSTSHISRIINSRSLKNDYKFKVDQECVDTALAEIFRNDNNTLLKPRKSAFPRLTNKDKSFSAWFMDDTISISFNHESNSVEWGVEEGNRTVDDSEYHYITLAFFSILRNYEWKHGERGETICVSENFDDDPSTPDSCSDTTRIYEKLTKKEEAKRKAFRIQCARSGNF